MPIDGSKTTIDALSKNRIAKEIIEENITRCISHTPSAGGGAGEESCQWVGTLGALAAHIDGDCAYHHIPCTNSGCGEVVERRALPTHLEKCPYHIKEDVVPVFAIEDKCFIKAAPFGWQTKLSSAVLQRGHRYFMHHRIDAHPTNNGHMMLGVWMDQPDKIPTDVSHADFIGRAACRGCFALGLATSSRVRCGDGREEWYRETPHLQVRRPYTGHVGVLLDLDPSSPRYRTLAIFTSDEPAVGSAGTAGPLRYRGIAAEGLPDTCDYRAAVTLRWVGDSVTSMCWMDGDIPDAIAVPAP